MTDLDKLLAQATVEITGASDLKILDDFRVAWLGKKGKVTAYLKTLGALPLAERPLAGQKINQVRDRIECLVKERLAELNRKKVAAALAADALDITLPGRRSDAGTRHPVTLVSERITEIFAGMGFATTSGPEIEDDYHNFSALNIPPFHPARAMQDTFYFPDNRLLRTHMSPVQVRAMYKAVFPLRVIAMGRVYRHDFDLTHTPMFHQVEGFMLDETNNISFAGLKGILEGFLRAFFADTEIVIRFRPSYFPFTEPSAEVDIGCLQCRAKGCRVCRQSGWLELLGCGMVHPEVLRMAGIDHERYAGWAFGAGLDRLAMLRYGISDLRELFENDLRFLQQFQGFSA
jgi:phenylalanyl-tRNA synthetase alpha chain